MRDQSLFELICVGGGWRLPREAREWAWQWDNGWEEIFLSSAFTDPWPCLGLILAFSFTDKMVARALLG